MLFYAFKLNIFYVRVKIKLLFSAGIEFRSEKLQVKQLVFFTVYIVLTSSMQSMFIMSLNILF